MRKGICDRKSDNVIAQELAEALLEQLNLTTHDIVLEELGLAGETKFRNHLLNCNPDDQDFAQIVSDANE